MDCERKDVESNFKDEYSGLPCESLVVHQSLPNSYHSLGHNLVYPIGKSHMVYHVLLLQFLIYYFGTAQ